MVAEPRPTGEGVPRDGGIEGGVARRRPRWLIASEHASAAGEVLAGVALVCAMLLTCADIVARALGRPIPGTYEIVSIAGGFSAGLALPATALARAHVRVELLAPVPTVVEVFTRMAGIGVLVMLAWGMLIVGRDLQESGEVTSVLVLPLYPLPTAWPVRSS